MIRKFLTAFLMANAVYAFSADFYLRGYDNDWDSLDFKFTEDKGVYTLYFDNLSNDNFPYGFKIASADWSEEFGVSGQTFIERAMDCTRVQPDMTDDEKSALSVYLPGHYTNTTQNVNAMAGVTLVFDCSDMSHPTLEFLPDMYVAYGWTNTDSNYRMKYDGNGMYTLDVARIPDSFTIAAGASPEWIVKYGGENGMVSGGTYRVYFEGADMTMNESVTDATIWFDRKFGTITVNKKPSEPDYDRTKTDLYLTGVYNNWNNSSPEFKMQNDNGIYRISVANLKGGFKIVDSSWDVQYGCQTDLKYGQIYKTKLAKSGFDMAIAEGDVSHVDIEFNSHEGTIRVDGMSTLYLTGDMNDWQILPQYEFSYNAETDEYSLVTDNFSGYFRVMSADMSTINFGSLDVTPGTAANLEHDYGNDSYFEGMKSDGYRAVSALPGKVRIVLYPNFSGVATEIEELPIENVIDTPDGETEYFNLQGIRVLNPRKGVFIKKTGNKTEKIIL